MTRLVCPFCREIFPASDPMTCPECGVVLRALDDLPRRDDALETQGHDPPEPRLPWYSPSGGRGVVLGLALLELTLFFAPWLTIRTPARYDYSGFELAMTRGFWFSGGAVAMLVLVALLSSRRTLSELRGVRAIAALLASVIAWQALFLLGVARTQGSGEVTHHFAPAFYASGVLGIVTAALALRLGSKRVNAVSRPTGTDATLH